MKSPYNKLKKPTTAVRSAAPSNGESHSLSYGFLHHGFQSSTPRFVLLNVSFAQFCSLFPKNIQKSPISTQFCSINKINNSININENENKNININEIIPEIITCDYCDYHTIRSGNFRRHINTCKNRKNEEVKYRLLYEKEKKGLIEQHEKEKQILYNQIDKLLEKVGNTTNHIPYAIVSFQLSNLIMKVILQAVTMCIVLILS